MKKLLTKLDELMNFQEAKAHCDVPCGIYDPITAQIAALTVIRMVDIMEGAHLEGEGKKFELELQNTKARCVANKEEHAEMVKHEIRIIWGDFIKPNHLQEYPNLHVLVHEIMMLGSGARQKVCRDTAVQLLDKVNEFAEIFWKIKGEEIVRAKAPYAPNLELVYRKI